MPKNRLVEAYQKSVPFMDFCIEREFALTELEKQLLEEGKTVDEESYIVALETALGHLPSRKKTIENLAAILRGILLPGYRVVVIDAFQGEEL